MNDGMHAVLAALKEQDQAFGVVVGMMVEQAKVRYLTKDSVVLELVSSGRHVITSPNTVVIVT